MIFLLGILQMNQMYNRDPWVHVTLFHRLQLLQIFQTELKICLSIRIKPKAESMLLSCILEENLGYNRLMIDFSFTKIKIKYYQFFQQ